jgi:chromosome segregation ATPase
MVAVDNGTATLVAAPLAALVAGGITWWLNRGARRKADNAQQTANRAHSKAEEADVKATSADRTATAAQAAQQALTSAGVPSDQLLRGLLKVIGELQAEHAQCKKDISELRSRYERLYHLYSGDHPEILRDDP